MDASSDLIKIFGGAGFGILAATWLFQMLVKSALSKDVKDFEQRLKFKADSELAALSAEYRRRVDAELATLQDRLIRERDEAGRTAAAAAQRDERLRAEILRWANPIRGAVLDLRGRLRNVLQDDAYPALWPTPGRPMQVGWSIEHAYFLPSTLYVFCQFFQCVRRVETELGFDLFVDHAEKDALFSLLNRVVDALGEWRSESTSGPDDCQVFRLQQRALGESLTVRTEGNRCMDYPEFLLEYDEPPLKDHLAPLMALVEGLDPELHPHRWQRLSTVLSTLEDLAKHTDSLLHPARTVGATS